MRLTITADDYGYAPSYDAGIVEAALAGAVDCVSAMVTRGDADPDALAGSGVEVGLHLELGPMPGWPRGGSGGAGETRRKVEREGQGAGGREEEEREGERQGIERAVAEQIALFEAVFRVGPAYLDGHHHCHAHGAAAAVVASVGRRLGLPVRSVDTEHRRLLRAAGVRTADRLVGRLSEDEDALSSEVRAVLRGAGTWGGRDRGEGGPSEVREELRGGGGGPWGGGLVEWMTHPGYPVRVPRQRSLPLVRPGGRTPAPAGLSGALAPGRAPAGAGDPSTLGPTSDYDAGRGEDLRVLLALAKEPTLRALRTGWS